MSANEDNHYHPRCINSGFLANPGKQPVIMHLRVRERCGCGCGCGDERTNERTDRRGWDGGDVVVAPTDANLTTRTKGKGSRRRRLRVSGRRRRKPYATFSSSFFTPPSRPSFLSLPPFRALYTLSPPVSFPGDGNFLPAARLTYFLADNGLEIPRDSRHDT